MHFHHDQHPGVQAALLKDVRSLTAVFEKSQDLMVLDTRDIMNSSVGEIVRRVEALGEE